MDQIPLKVEGPYIFYIEQLMRALAKIQALFLCLFSNYCHKKYTSLHSVWVS